MLTTESDFYSDIDERKDGHEMDGFGSDDLTVFVSFLCVRFWDVLLSDFREDIFY
jgi:hypothetical protein